MRLITLVFVIVMLLARPAVAHSDEEREAWLAAWQQRMTHDGLTDAYVTEYWVFVGSHTPDGARVASAPLPVVVADGVEQWRSLVEQYFRPEDVDRALCLMGFESGGNSDARNKSSDAAGLMQVMPFWASHYGVAYAALFDPNTNLRIASGIRASQGWTAWSPYLRGECR